MNYLVLKKKRGARFTRPSRSKIEVYGGDDQNLK